LISLALSTYIPYITMIVAVIVLLFLTLFILKKRKQEKPKLKKVDTSELILALGDLENITSISFEHQRLKVMIKEIKRVKQDLLKTLEIPVFLKGKELTLLIKHQTKEVFNDIKTRIGA